MLDFEMASGSDARAVLEALGRSLAIVEFEPDGTVLSANENFCQALGYDASEIKGLHHRIFVEPSHAESTEYRDFWTKLGKGEFEAREYKCIGKDGREIWFQASYNPIKDKRGVVLKVVAAATDVSGVKLRYAPWNADPADLSRDRPMIEFTATGNVITANDKFLNTFSYNLDEVQGKHHSHFVEPVFAQSRAYQSFWKRLDGGEYVSASFKCVGKGGKEVWIQASYNPVFDGNRQIVKIVKFADDISDFKEIESGLARLALNDLGQLIEKPFDPHLESLRLTFNQAVAHVGSALRDIGEKADAIDGGLKDVLSSSTDLSQTHDRQAMKLEEAAAAIGHMMSTARKAAESAGHTHRAVVAVDDDAKSSAVVVRKAAESMDAVASSAQQIRHIIGVIDEIAFQTNLLALTAGVEATRCGDTGHGFGIVATEVRRLAQRSSEAAKEVKGLILTSTTQVQHGVALIGEIGRSLKRVISHVAAINDGISDIAASAEGQAMELAGVDITIDQLVDITQKNVETIEQKTALSERVSRDLEDLSQRIARFRAGSRPAAPTSPLSPKGATASVIESHAKSRGANRSIRAFEEADIPRVCDLFARTFRPGRPFSAERLAACIRETYIAPPSYTPQTGSIVHLNAGGNVDGFMGVIPVLYRLGERSISAGILSAFMADNPKENPTIGVSLLRGVMARSFDLLVTDTANQTSLMMCRATRFAIMPHQSLEWFKLLRPAKTGVRLLGKKSPLAAWVFKPAAAVLDGLFFGSAPSPSIKDKRFQGVTDRLIDTAQFVAEAPAFLDTYSLRPQWAPQDLNWMVEQARLQTKNGDLETHAVYDKGGQQAGLYLLYVRKGFVAYVLQLLAKPGREEIVIDRVITRAAEAGAIAIRGAVTRETAHGLLCRPGVLYHHVMSTVAWTSDREIAAAVQSGDVFIGGLAGETWAKIVAEDF